MYLAAMRGCCAPTRAASIFSCSTRRIFIARPGGPYAAPDGSDWPDNPFRFAALAGPAPQLALGRAAGFSPDIVHAHDWQAGLAAGLSTAMIGRRAPRNGDHRP